MKFGKAVQGELQHFPAEVRQHCLDYRSWKKKAHEPRLLTAVSWKLRLARDCARLDKFLTELRGTQSLDQEALDRLMLINTDILYKVCKRLEKRSGVPAMQHYRAIIRKHQYAFTGVSALTLLPDYAEPLTPSSAGGSPKGTAAPAGGFADRL